MLMDVLTARKLPLVQPELSSKLFTVTLLFPLSLLRVNDTSCWTQSFDV